MSTIVVQAFVTLDGVVQSGGAPDEDREGGFEHGGWALAYDEQLDNLGEVGEIVGKWESRTEALLLGRRTYEIFAGSWGVWDENAEGLQGELTASLSTHSCWAGKKLFSDGFVLARLTLVETRALRSGVLVNTYRPSDAGRA